MARFFYILVFAFAFVNAEAADPVTRKPAKERLKYAAKDSTEAWLSFDYSVEYIGTSSEAVAMKAIEKQLLHLYGPMGEGFGEAGMVGAPKNKHTVTLRRIERLEEYVNSYRAHYSYRGLIALQKGDDSAYTIALPRDPSTIYHSAKSRTGNVPCTDENYQAEGDFWYFWNPHMNAACKRLLRAGEEYDVLDAKNNKLKVERIPNTAKSYPEYARLVRGPAGQKYIRMDVLFGMDDAGSDPDPMVSRDLSAPNFRSLVEQLEKRGYKKQRKWNQREIREIVGDRVFAYPYVLEMTKDTSAGIQLIVRIFFGQSGIEEDSMAFHYFLKDAIENASVFVYAGHSGFDYDGSWARGQNFNLGEIEKLNEFTIQPPKDEYQILFFNGCSSYPFYSEYFFDRKKTSRDPRGTKNVDVITNGLATYFTVIDVADFYLFNAVTDWADGRGALSYQELATAADTDNLYGVNGDEDNPKSEDHEYVAPPRNR